MTDVLVVGAGPVGLTLTHELLRRGVRVRLIDSADGPSVTSRALATHARSLEIYDQMGIVDRVLARGRRVQHFTMHQRGRRLVRFGPDYSELPTRFPFTLVIDQALTEEVLREAVEGLGTAVEWGVRLEDLRQNDTEAIATLRRADGSSEQVRTPWLVGCDGGHSTVRKRLELPLIGDSSERWLIADASVEVDLPTDSLHLMHLKGGTIMLVPFPQEGRWRLLDTVDVSYDGDKEALAARFADKIRTGCGLPATVRDLTWVSVFDIQQRMIPRMRDGRCFVAGDAAHVHSPASGQGLNTGVQDAFNLAWKLAMVVRGHARDPLLDSFSAERVPVGRALLDTTKTATRMVALKSAVQGVALPIAFAVIRNTPPLKGKIERKIMRGMTALALRYDDSPLTHAGTDPAARGPRPGGRVTEVTEADAAQPGWSALLAQLRDGRWTLAVTADADRHLVSAVGKEHADWLSPHVVDEVVRRGLGLASQGWLLVRPDGYVSDRGERLDPAALTAAFARLHLSAALTDPVR
ncbi:FAD-dependent monooxygenase [Crossiella sp. CA-258035]|uniref:FAD-dependent monooxygenase n=1 Tax=Crossiella sp. CA-258035 TaxID=2981138 RepID=UPI0024BC1FCB|nr:FAD-dependent monooxygenase [Crossiella sp. CA-258035]WHT23336.1 FAD-dependent monooxygenase [Crossiella sp. CA-258035]